MSAVVAHEIRNPIAGISAGVDYLSRNAPPGSPEKQGAEMIQGEIERVNRIVEDILFVARPLYLDRVRQPLAPIVATILQRNQAQLDACQVQAVVHISEELPELELDEQRLEQVFGNLIDNAVQAMVQGGQITISATARNSQVIIRVTDSGPGIASNLLARIFDPFYTTKTKGTGLGLSVARRIIEAHKGTIAVESQSGQGTSFIISLPVPTGDVS
jgi:two-component system sensor histidine kinase HydH